MLAVLL